MRSSTAAEQERILEQHEIALKSARETHEQELNRLRENEAKERELRISDALKRAAEEFEEKLRHEKEEHTKEIAGESQKGEAAQNVIVKRLQEQMERLRQ